jgi:hypothetical protein
MDSRFGVACAWPVGLSAFTETLNLPWTRTVKPLRYPFIGAQISADLSECFQFD